MLIGRKIYYDLETGNVIQDTGERSGDVIETTQEQDFLSYTSLAERISNTVGVIQLDYGQYAQEFIECTDYRVDVSGKVPTLFFTYPEGDSTPPSEPVYHPQTLDLVTALKTNVDRHQQTLDDITLVIAELLTKK